VSTLASLSILNSPVIDTEKRHRLRLHAGYGLAISLILGLALYGFDYYFLEATQRPFSSKHLVLKPNGSIGLWAGVLGAVLFLAIFLYPLRKRWTWLQQQGNTRHWLDFHVLLGLTAPLVIALHASFKFRGLAGMAFWIMAAVALSGVAGRYLYAQIPRSLSAAELSLKEAQELLKHLSGQLAEQKVVPSALLAPIFHLPRAEEVRSETMLVALGSMVTLDFKRAFAVARLRRQAAGAWGALTTLGGLLTTGNSELERVIDAAYRQAFLSKRILFLSRSQQVFHLWHVVHRPFSYSFAVLAGAHIMVVMLFGVR
jgi:hypothetical protein